MKKIYSIAIGILLTASIWSQAPQKMSYQAVIRNSSNALVTSTAVGMKISVLQGSATGTAAYVETQNPTTNTNGLVSLEIGTGTPVIGTFATINWANGPYFIKTETDPTAGTNYTIVGTSELLSVPYALHAKTVENLSGINTGDQDLSGLATTSSVTSSLATKVDKETGKGLSTNDYTTVEQTKLAAITGTNTGDQDLSGLATTSSVTSGLATKVDKETGKGLSTNDYTTIEKNKLAAITGTNTGDQDLSGLATTSSVNSSLTTKVDKETGKVLSSNDYTTVEKNKLAAISGTNTGDQDLSGLATTSSVTSSLATKVDKETGKGLQADGSTAGQMQYWNGSAWVFVPPASSNLRVLYFINNVPQWGPIISPTDVISSTGKIWMDRNLGATQVATSSTDAASYGYLYQWGRGADGHQLRTSTTTATLSSTDVPGNTNFILSSNSIYDWRSTQNDNLWQGVNGVNNPCPSGYRIPTETELDAERASWTANNSSGAFASPLKLPLAGYRSNFHGGSLEGVSLDGYYWSSTINGIYSRLLHFYGGDANVEYSYRVFGFTVRCIKE